jgi:hypothetical protein
MVVAIGRHFSGYDRVTSHRRNLGETASAVSVNRRNALAAVVPGGLTATAIRADEQPPADVQPEADPILSQGLPDAVRRAFTDALPGYWCVRLAVRGEGDGAVYRATVFHPSRGQTSNVIGEEAVTTPRFYDVELDARGESLEETVRPTTPDHVPQAVLAAYEKWNPKSLKRMATMWSTEVPRGKDRVYRVYILVNQNKRYRAFFKDDGTVVEADPTDK